MKRVSYTNKQKIDEIVRRYQLLYKKNPTSKIFAPLADAFRKQGRLDEALSICLEGVRNHPNYSSGRLALGKCYFDKHMFEKAIFELEAVKSANPLNIMAKTYLGKAYLGARNYEKALKSFSEAWALAPSNKKLANIVKRLETKIRVVYGSVERETSQESLDQLSKRPLFAIDSDNYVVRNLKDIFVKKPEVKIEKSLAPEFRKKSNKEALKKLFITRGLNQKAKEILPTQKEKEPFIPKTPEKMFSYDAANVRDSIVKKEKLIKRPININHVALADASILPGMVKDKNDYDQHFFPDFEDDLTQEFMEETTVEDEEKAMKNETFLKHYDGASEDPRAEEKKKIIALEKQRNIEEKKAVKQLTINKLSSILNRIQERAY